MTVEKKDGWLEIELNPVADAKAEEVKEEAKESGEQTQNPEEEKPSFDGKRAERRIKQLTRRAKSAEEAVEEQRKRADAMAAEVEKIRAEFEAIKRGGAQNQEQQLIQRYNDAKARLLKAQEEADHAGVVKATEDMGDAQARWHLLKAQPKAPEREEVVKETPTKEAPRKPALREKAQEWVDAQDWWTKDKVLRAATTAIAHELEVDEEMDPDSDEYYRELDKRLRKEFPQKFKVAQAEEVEQAVSGSRGGGGGGGAKESVKLSQSERDTARRMGLTDREYALEKIRVERTQDKAGYTAIDIVRKR